MRLCHGGYLFACDCVVLIVIVVDYVSLWSPLHCAIIGFEILRISLWSPFIVRNMGFRGPSFFFFFLNLWSLFIFGFISFVFSWYHYTQIFLLCGYLN